MIGMWMWPVNVQKYGAEKVVSWCSRAKVTDLYFLVKGLAGLTAHHGSCAPHVCECDLLKEVLDAAHAKGIRVHAWFTSASDKNYFKLHPESGRCHFTRGRDRGLISLADEGYLQYMEKVVGEVCRLYEIDGLHLDYIRYNHLTYGWASEDLERYAACGADPEYLQSLMRRAFFDQPENEKILLDAYHEGDPSVAALARARRKDVVRFARRLISTAQAEKNSLILSAALMPEGAYDDTAFADLHYGQNYEDAAGIYEYALPMAYSAAYGQNEAWVRKVAEGTLKRGLKTLVGLHAYEGGTGIQLQRDIDGLRDLPVDGICLFREGASALAFVRRESVAICNPMDQNVTKVMLTADGKEFLCEETILPGEEISIALSGNVQQIRVFSGDAECGVYMTKEE